MTIFEAAGVTDNNATVTIESDEITASSGDILHCVSSARRYGVELTLRFPLNETADINCVVSAKGNKRKLQCFILDMVCFPSRYNFKVVVEDNK